MPYTSFRAGRRDGYPVSLVAGGAVPTTARSNTQLALSNDDSYGVARMVRWLLPAVIARSTENVFR
jgi:hypothetical protein